MTVQVRSEVNAATLDILFKCWWTDTIALYHFDSYPRRGPDRMFAYLDSDVAFEGYSRLGLSLTGDG